MTQYNWSRYIRGLEGFSGKGLIHHAINGNIIIVTSTLFDYIEDKKTEGIPQDLKDKLIDLGMLVPDFKNELIEFDNAVNNRINYAKAGNYIKYCYMDQINDNYSYVNRVLKELCDINSNNKICVITHLNEKIMELIPSSLGQLKFVMKLDIDKDTIEISNEILDKLLDYNIGLLIIGSYLDENIHLTLKKYIEYGISVVYDLRINSIEEFYSYQIYFNMLNININYQLGNVTQQELVKLYDSVIELRNNQMKVSTNWDIPLLRMKNEKAYDYGVMGSIQIKDMQTVLESLNGNQYLNNILFVNGKENPCHKCGLEGICRGFFYKNSKLAVSELCFLAKYSIAKSMG